MSKDVQIIVGDAVERMKEQPENSVDSIVTDPPYHLTTGKKGGSGPASVNLESPYGRARVTTGFMGMEWDGGDVAMRPETWAEALRIAKPGAYLLAFGGTRTFHRLACAIEDAGWEIRDCLMWVYGSGFPKSLDVSKAIDKAAGVERARYDRPAFGGTFSDDDGTTYGTAISDEPITEAARQWSGWGTALKPAWEPIILARKPLAGTVAENVQQYGTGGLNIDGCRIAIDDEEYARNCSGDRGHDGTRSIENRGATDLRPGGGKAADGRWPANLIHDGSEEVVRLFPQAKSGSPVSGNEPSKTGEANCYGKYDRVAFAGHKDSGSAARFFYCAKASKQDRDEGLEGLGLNGPGRTCYDPQYHEGGGKLPPRTGNFHPTVKPTDLMRYLCRLVTPPGGLVCDLFTGSGSTGKAARIEGFRFLGFEMNPDYAEIANLRIASALKSFSATGNKPKPAPVSPGQLSLFGDSA